MNINAQNLHDQEVWDSLTFHCVPNFLEYRPPPQTTKNKIFKKP